MTTYADITFQENTFSLSGEIDFSNVMSVLAKSESHFRSGNQLIIDFSQLKNSNSAGLALIIEWIKLARQYNKTIKFKAIHANLMAIATAAGLEHIIAS